jgi:hypothetical protein
VLPAVLALGAASAFPFPDCGAPDEPTEVLVFDWKRGTYQGVRLGDDTARLRRVLGRPQRRGPNEPFEPIGEDFYDIGGLTNFGYPEVEADGDYDTFRYRRRVFSTTGGTVTAWGTTDPRAQTPEGVGIGDERDLVGRRYASADCFTQNEGSEYPEYPICRVRVCAGRLLGFGGDPIKSLWLAAETRAGMKSCRPPG